MNKLNFTPNNKEMRNFGWVILIGFGVIGIILYFKGLTTAAALTWIASMCISFLSFFLPLTARPFYWIWMGFGIILGKITSRITMTLIFYLILTPVAVFFRMKKRDILQLKRKNNTSSYWSDHPEITDVDYYRHLF